MDIYKLDNIFKFAKQPVLKTEFDVWVKQDDVVDFLNDDLLGSDIILYASLPSTLIHCALVPLASLESDAINDLQNWNHTPYSGWSVWCRPGEKEWIEPPMADSDSSTLKVGEQILFVRSFDGVKGMGGYIEIAQKLTQVLGLHFMHERKAWCKLDDNGDIDDVIKTHLLKQGDDKEWGKIVSIDYQELAKYCDLTGTALVRMFDVDRIDHTSFTGWDDSEELSIDDRGVFGRKRVLVSQASYFRGVQLHEMKHFDTVNHPKEYASFIAHDWKNKRIEEISCSPDSIDNYFTKSDKPFEVTPAFFRPEVLLKYKSDTDKYSLDSRSISCRGSWHLQTYDINDAGQVHTYLIYLSKLPYNEQLHWKQFNEYPKAPISERAKINDFDGDFYDGYYPLDSLKRKLSDLEHQHIDWWIQKNLDVMDSLHPVVSASIDEWKDEILKLDQVLVEGFVEKKLRVKATQLGRNPDPKYRSLKLVEECLMGLGFETEHAREISSPLHVVHDLRNKLKGHITGETAEKIRSEAIEEFGSYTTHFENLCNRCDESMEIIINAFTK